MTTLKRRFRKIFIQLTIVIAIAFQTNDLKAQTPVEVITAGATITKQVYKAVSWIRSHKELIIAIFHGFRYNHRWWACIYKDGFVTYNNFRSYRTSVDAYNYFVLGHGDCDAIYGSQNKHICYETPLQAKKYSKQHGPVVDIQYQDDKGKYRSILKY